MAADRVTLELRPERSGHANESIWLQVTVGALDRGASIRVNSADGALLGSVSPYSAQARTAGGSYLISLPHALTRELPIRLTFTLDRGPPHPRRAPTPAELLNAKLVLLPTSK